MTIYAPTYCPGTVCDPCGGPCSYWSATIKAPTSTPNQAQQTFSYQGDHLVIGDLCTPPGIYIGSYDSSHQVPIRVPDFSPLTIFLYQQESPPYGFIEVIAPDQTLGGINPWPGYYPDVPLVRPDGSKYVNQFWYADPVITSTCGGLSWTYHYTTKGTPIGGGYPYITVTVPVLVSRSYPPLQPVPSGHGGDFSWYYPDLTASGGTNKTSISGGAFYLPATPTDYIPLLNAKVAVSARGLRRFRTKGVPV